MQRRTLNLVLALSALAPLGVWLAPRPAAAQSAPDVKAALAPRILGADDAPATMIEYFSLTCPHCAAFHQETYPKIRDKYINTGLLKFELRDFPLDQWALRAAAMARCAPSSRYFALIDVLLKQQPRWARSDDPLAALKTIGRLAGLGPNLVEACMTNKELLDGILEKRLEGQKEFEIRSTPSFVLNGRTVTGALTFEEFDKLLAEATGSI